MGAYEQFYRMTTLSDEDGDVVVDTPPAREPFRLLIDEEARRQVISDMLSRYGASRRKENFGREDDEDSDSPIHEVVSSSITTLN